MHKTPSPLAAACGQEALVILKAHSMNNNPFGSRQFVQALQATTAQRAAQFSDDLLVAWIMCNTVSHKQGEAILRWAGRAARIAASEGTELDCTAPYKAAQIFYDWQ